MLWFKVVIVCCTEFKACFRDLPNVQLFLDVVLFLSISAPPSGTRDNPCPYWSRRKAHPSLDPVRFPAVAPCSSPR